MRIVHSAVGRRQGRGKIERVFGALTTELLSALPGRIDGGKTTAQPSLTLPDLDTTIGQWIMRTYHTRPPSQTGTRPVTAWLADGWLPQMPESLADLDVLLVTVAKPRLVRRDGIRLMGLRSLATALASFVGEYVTMRCDPGDLAEIRVFHKNRSVCSAVCPELATEAVTLADIQAARGARRRRLRQDIQRCAVADTSACAASPPACPLGMAEPLLTTSGPRDPSDAALAQRKAVFHTPAVNAPVREVRGGLDHLITRVEGCIDLALHPGRMTSKCPSTHGIALLVIDEAERRAIQSLEHVRDIFDQTGIGVILIGMPGIERRLERYPDSMAASASPTTTVRSKATSSPSCSPDIGANLA